jgi:hypothetical protein
VVIDVVDDGTFGDNVAKLRLLRMFGSSIKLETRMNAVKEILKWLLIAEW